MPRKPQRLELTWFNKDQALIPLSRGKYGYSWVDPRDPRYCEVHTLTETDRVAGVQAEKVEGTTYSERADLPPTTDNLLVQGESGDVLEALHYVPELADKYVGQVKLCYIDPPFNTAEAFTQSNYEDNLEHSIWLTMMRDRLLHIRALLSDNGSVWVHLDDGENHRMRCLLDEVFGAGNYVAEMQWKKTYSPRNDSSGIPMTTDPIIVYRKSSSFTPNKLTRTAAANARYKNPDADPRGPWKMGDTTAPGRLENQQIFIYGIQHPLTGKMIYPSGGRTWNIRQEWLLEIMRGWGRYELGDVTDEELSARAEVFGSEIVPRYRSVRPLVIPRWSKKDAEYACEVLNNGPWPRYTISKRPNTKFGWKTYLSDKEGSMAENFLHYAEVGHTDGAKKEIKALFPGINPFSTPKPERLLERIIHIGSNPGDIVLDVFAGSGTTAAVAHKMGRRWVTAELLPETVATFTRPRLEKVVRGEDPGGVTVTEGLRVDATEDGLPEGLSPAEANAFTSALNKVVKADPALKNDATVKALKAATKTRNPGDVVNWRGGGGFRVLELSPCVFDYRPDLGLVTLTDAAHGEMLVSSVAANLGFTLTPEDRPLHGRKGSMRLVVLDGTATEQTVDDVLAHLPDGERVTIAATGVADGVRAYLRKTSPGSVVKHVPDDLFPYPQTTSEG